MNPRIRPRLRPELETLEDRVVPQANRTWVSGVGDDANPGSRTAPCKTFAGVITKTAVGGEIDALDPGGFGAVTITKSITIDGGGNTAGVLVSGRFSRRRRCTWRTLRARTTAGTCRSCISATAISP
jgi:hypothetical protein